jgi:hypothetical protein
MFINNPQFPRIKPSNESVCPESARDGPRYKVVGHSQLTNDLMTAGSQNLFFCFAFSEQRQPLFFSIQNRSNRHRLKKST